MNIEQARTNMITQQLHTWGVLDPTVLELFAKVPRELFVPIEYKNLAFADTSIPIGHDQMMLTPTEEARIMQAVAVQPEEHVLEIGTGSGYMTALLAKLAKHVDSVDIFAEFTAAAQAKFTSLKIRNVTLDTADAASGWSMQPEYDVIVITGSLPFLPEYFRKILKRGGRLFAILGAAPAMEAMLFKQDERGFWQEQKIFETVVQPLINAQQNTGFVF